MKKNTFTWPQPTNRAASCSSVTFSPKRKNNILGYIEKVHVIQQKEKWRNNSDDQEAAPLYTCWSMSDTYTVLRIISSRWARLVLLFILRLPWPKLFFWVNHTHQCIRKQVNLVLRHSRMIKHQPAPKITQTEQWEPNFYSEKHKYIEFKMSFFFLCFSLTFSANTRYTKIFGPKIFIKRSPKCKFLKLAQSAKSSHLVGSTRYGILKNTKIKNCKINI